MADEIQTMTVMGDAYIPILGISVETGDIVQYHYTDDGKAVVNKIEKGAVKKTKKEAI